MAQHVERDFDLLCDKKNNSPHARNNYCFTWNNYTPELEGQFRSWLEFNCKYAIYGHEIAPVTGTPHLQGFFSLKTKKRMTTLQKRFGENHIKLALFVAKGSAQQNRAYCTKADKENYFEHGNIEQCGSGSRTDLLEVTQKLKEGSHLSVVAMQHPVEYVKYSRGLKEFASIVSAGKVDKIRDITVSVYWGTGGVGKTYRAYDECQKLGLGEPYPLMNPHKNTGSIWFDNYEPHMRALLIDDFYGWIQPHILYRYLDKYPLQMEIKGATIRANWTYVFITSNKHPQDWYKAEVYAQLDKNAYWRRLHNIAELAIEDGDRVEHFEKQDKPLFPLEESDVDQHQTLLEDIPKSPDIRIIPPTPLDLNDKPGEEDETYVMPSGAIFSLPAMHITPPRTDGPLPLPPPKRTKIIPDSPPYSPPQEFEFEESSTSESS